MTLHIAPLVGEILNIISSLSASVKQGNNEGKIMKVWVSREIQNKEETGKGQKQKGGGERRLQQRKMKKKKIGGRTTTGD